MPCKQLLADLAPPDAVRLRRDFGKLLRLIEAHAILHQATRDLDSNGVIVATLRDYAAVRELVHDLLTEGAHMSVSDETRETVMAVKARNEEKVPEATGSRMRR